MIYGRNIGLGMIITIELQFSKWEHEDCNAGILELIKSVASEKVIFAATKQHVKYVESIVNLEDVEKCYIEIPKTAYANNLEMLEDYEKIIEDILERYKVSSDDKIVFLSSPKNVMLAARKVIDVGIAVYFVQHANLDWILERENERIGDYSYAEIIKLCCGSGNVYNLAMNPFVKIGLTDILDDKTLKTFHFLHHPVKGSIPKSINANKTTIGVYGQCVNANFGRILKQSKEENLLKRFMVLRSCDSNHMDYSFKLPKELRIYQKPGGFDKSELLNAISRMGWILLPYSKDMYKVSMSGILADAIRYSIPIIALNSPIVDYYNEYIIGIVAETPEALVESLVSEGNKNYTKYKENMQKLKSDMIDAGEMQLRKVLYENG